MSWKGAEQLIPQGKTNFGSTSESMKGNLAKELNGDLATSNNRTTAINEKVESWYDDGIEAMREDDGDNEGEEDDDDEEGDNEDLEATHANDSTADGTANSNTTCRRKKVRKRRRVRKRNNNSVNDINEGSHHSTSHVVDGVKPSNPMSPGKGSTSKTSLQQVQLNQRSKKPHDAPMTKSDLYYAIRFGMVQVEVDVIQALPQATHTGQGSSESTVITTIVRDVIGRVLLVNWDNVTVYSTFVLPELSSTQQALLQEEFNAFKPSKWTDGMLPYTFQVKRIVDYRSEHTGILPQYFDAEKSTKEHSAHVSTVSISDLKPILKKFIKGKIVIGYNVQTDLQIIDGMTHPKSDVRDVAQFGPYMTTIVTARPMSLHTSQDKQQIVHYEPRPLSHLIDTYYTSADSSSATNSKNMHGVLFREAVGCLHLYKRVRSEWEDELCRLSRHRYKLPPISAKSTESKVVPLPPPVLQHETEIPLHGLAPLKQYYQDLSPPMMKHFSTDVPSNKHQSLPLSSYQQTPLYIDRGIRTKQYEDLRFHQSDPSYAEQRRWAHGHVSSGTLDPPYALPTSQYHKQTQTILPASSPTSQPPQRAFFGKSEYGTSPRSWEMQRHPDTKYLLQGTERLSTSAGMRWLHSHEDNSTFQKSGSALQADPWSAASSFQLSNITAHTSANPALSIRTGDTATMMSTEKRQNSNIDSLDHRGSLDNVADRNDRLLPTLPSNTWSPLLTDSLSLLSIFNENATTASGDNTASLASTLPLPHASTTTGTDPVLLGTGGDNKNAGSMFQWDELLSSINDVTQQHR